MTPSEKNRREVKEAKTRIEHVPTKDGGLITCYSKYSIQV